MVSPPPAADQCNHFVDDRIERAVRPGQINLDGGSLAHLAVDLDVAPGLPDEAIHLAQAKPGALAGLAWW